MNRSLTIGILLIIFLWWGNTVSPIQAQVSGCGATVTNDGKQCIILRNTNNCPQGRGPVIAGAPPNCTCTCQGNAPVINTGSGPYYGNDCLGGNCGYPDSGLLCGNNEQGIPMCLRSNSLPPLNNNITNGESESDNPPTICVVENIFRQILTYALGFAGIALFIMFIIGGFKWLTAGTDEAKVQQARKTFIYALVGLAVTIGAWYILLFVREFTGIDVTSFGIPGCT